LIWIFCETKTGRKQELAPKINIKCCQKYVKVVEYWHETIKNYRYDGDVSMGLLSPMAVATSFTA
jgi:hypothetical protein